MDQFHPVAVSAHTSLRSSHLRSVSRRGGTLRDAAAAWYSSIRSWIGFGPVAGSKALGCQFVPRQSARLELINYKAGLDLVIERAWLELQESGTYVRLLTSEAAN